MPSSIDQQPNICARLSVRSNASDSTATTLRNPESWGLILRACLRKQFLFAVILFSANLFLSNSHADPLVEQETRSAQARNSHGVTGRGVAVAILDRGIDWTHPDFRLADGSTRIAYLLDLTDPSGASRPDNPVGAGTLYTRADINAALAGGTALPTRDAVGHGTATAGNCCGNGRASDGRYVGMAPESTLLIVKFVSDGAPAHGNQPAEAYFYRSDLFNPAVDFVVAKAKELGLPLVMLANFGSQWDRADGSDAFAKKIDSVVGPGKPGLAFVTGTGDDGGRNNHASGTVGSGQTVSLRFVKGQSNTVWARLWYAPSDRFTIAWQGPSGNQGPFTAPANNSYDTRNFSGLRYDHYGSSYFDNRWRLIQLELTGPVGTYTLQITGSTVVSGQFEAVISPAYYWYDDANRFLDATTPEKTIWSGASAQYNIAPNSYVFRHSWQDLDNITRTVSNQGGLGELWAGSSVGPTWDGRVGVDVSAPGERTITSYAANSYWATRRYNLVSDGAGLYGIASAVSAAAPVTAGAIALMLEKNPELDAPAIKAALHQGARADAFTGAFLPNTRFGFGKLDVQGALDATPVVLRPPTITIITAGPGKATIHFLPPTNTSGAPIASYTASCAATGQTTKTATGAGSPITVTGLKSGVAYSCSLTASNGSYTSASSASTAVTPDKSSDITPILILLLD